MELEELKTLAAASLISGSVFSSSSNGGRTSEIMAPNAKTIATAVEVAGRIWEEVLRQERTR